MKQPNLFANDLAIFNALIDNLHRLEPPPNLKPSVWAEQNIIISSENAKPGPIDFDNAPYQRVPLDLTNDPNCYRITLMWSAQVGKTQLALCAQAYRIAHKPMNQLMMQPSEGDLKTWLETKFNPMVESNPVLRSLIAKPRGREGVNNQRMKSYPGGFLMFSWSGSSNTMRGRSAPFIVCDETDGYEATPEGNAVNLLWQRAATFGDQRKLLEISTPTIKGESWIESAYEDGDKRRFYVPCPHCDHHQPLSWRNVIWDKDEQGKHLPETAKYACEGCGVLWSNAERVTAIIKAEEKGAGWKAEKPFKGHASFHLSELYSLFVSLSQIVTSFLEKKASNDLQTFVNVSLAETWEEECEKVDCADLQERAEIYAAEVPAGGVYLTSGIDMQENRLEVETVAWGLGEESWSIDYRVLWGDPLQGDVWDDLDEYLEQTFQHESGAQLAISSACLDTGGSSGYTQCAYEYLRTRKGRKLFGIKGMPGWGRPIVAKPSKSRSKHQRPIDLFPVGVDEGKLMVMRRWGIQNEGPGYCHFPSERQEDWFKQITSEKLLTKFLKGHPKREWHKNSGDRNEGLDCRVYALAALKIMNPNLKKLHDRLVTNEEDETETPTLRSKSEYQEKPPEEKTTPKRQTRRKVSKRPRRPSSNWVYNY